MKKRISFSNASGPLKREGHRQWGDTLTKDDSVVDGDDPVLCIFLVKEVEKLVGKNLMCGVCVEDEKKLFEEMLINAIPYKYHGGVCLILRSVKGGNGVKAKMRHIGCTTSVA
eukprot:15352847-Ditylum_brightwellii.AAC.1